MFAKGHAVAPDITGILIQDAVPDPADIDKGWIPTSGGVARYPGYVFIWHAVLGHWVSRHPIEASDPSRRIYVGDAASITTYDGGDAGPINQPATGPMWEIDTAFAGSAPVGVGLIPGSSPAATIVNPLDTADSLGNSGEYKHSLTPDEIQHMHGTGQDPNILIPGTIDDPAIELHRDWSSAPETYVTSRNDMNPTSASGYTDGAAISSGIFATTKALADPDFPVVDGHLNMQPYVGVYFLKRTSRIWIVAA